MGIGDGCATVTGYSLSGPLAVCTAGKVEAGLDARSQDTGWIVLVGIARPVADNPRLSQRSASPSSRRMGPVCWTVFQRNSWNAFIRRFDGVWRFFIFRPRPGRFSGNSPSMGTVTSEKIRVMNNNKKIILGLALAGSLSVASARASFAESVVDYTSGNLPSSGAGFTNAASALGEPSRATPGTFGGPVDPFNAPYLQSQVVSLGTNGSLTVRMAQPVVNDPAHPYGLDFIVYGNAGFNIVNGDYSGGGITDGSLYGAGTGWSRVYVSADNVTYYALNSALAPLVDGLFPTDGSGDFSVPVNPTLTGADFADKGLTDSRRLYQGSGGGAGYDLAWAEDVQGRRVTLNSVQFIKVVSLGGHLEIDGFSSVAAVPEPAMGALVLLGAGLAVMGLRQGKRS